ncbi:hypothetical protein AMK22_29925 [Streptomyces sp. CB01580]|nr:hypothetical protein AMK22_29925 [Streptomyces sp. CB01580]
MALGVVPNMIEKLKDSVWTFLAAFVAAILGVLLGWTMLQKRGAGVVVQLFPHLQESRLELMKNCSRAQHDSTLLLDRRQLRPAGRTLPLPELLDLTATFIDARVIEQRGPNLAPGHDPSSAVSLYPLVPLRDGFLLGRRLSYEHHDLTIMYLNGSVAVPGVVLSPQLRAPLAADERAHAETVLHPVPDPSNPPPFQACPVEHQHHLALIVRLSPAEGMTSTARAFARTGSVRWPTTSRHTGYVFDSDDPEAPGTPCGTHFTIEARIDRLPPDQSTFEAVTKYIHEVWRTARASWAETCSSGNIETRLFIMGPTPIAIALGWLTARDIIDVVHHELRLVNSPPPVPDPEIR